ncbi:MAG TPA: hypothetical protein VJ326_02535 [Thermoplasmata archaeon]|nr:hypothetical protein [Thermoplasmata archaeon]
MATDPDATSDLAGSDLAEDDAPEPTFVERLEKFVWISSGMFSVAALGLAFTGYVTFAAYEEAGSNFLAAIAASGIFGLTTYLKFGPPSE